MTDKYLPCLRVSYILEQHFDTSFAATNAPAKDALYFCILKRWFCDDFSIITCVSHLSFKIYPCIAAIIERLAVNDHLMDCLT